MRFSLAVIAALCVLVSSGRAEAGNDHTPTYVLVHGAFHGGWSWQKVAEKLRAGDAQVYTPTLTGLGERAHLARPDVGLSTHVQDIVSLIQMEDLHDVILVGHSYAGMVITGVAAAIPSRIKKLVYLDAVIPEPGQSFFGMIGFPAPPPEVTMLPSFPPEDFGLTEDDDIAYVGARLRPQPTATFEEPLVFSWSTLSKIPKAYIRCTGEWFSRETFKAFAAKARAWHWDYDEIDSGHDAMVTEVSDTVKAIRRAAR
ncbi:alpha/beta hydrolase [Hyalangium versicolor]|uniref:alpha/beta hydrolase n=1 Tax=Hyalangium versicolor TaxID=2861190 RepID=UPI001CCBEC64|nr:alpha/beta fold hydrolase [Hyalangium versicolor]